ncbi:SHOCT domain-containing protein [Demequina aurantiaca]|uniref:SHOCT domain-containing protein n=1 Tax=Demequina aurantiaca TaxID=676200 RepID=UPI003D3377E5
MARTAVVAGTATAVSGNVARRQQGKAQAAQASQEAQYGQIQQDQAVQDSQAQIASMQAQLNAQQAAVAPAGGSDLLSQIEELAKLKNAGVLNDAEFTAAKAKLLSA